MSHNMAQDEGILSSKSIPGLSGPIE